MTSATGASLGLLVGALQDRSELARALTLLGAGFCGSFTTFSTVMAQGA